MLGIPEAEFTPRVRDAIMTLMHEVDRLRKEVEHARAKLDDMARTADQDMLLPILNRRAFVREITRFTAFAERYKTSSSLIYIDLNNFKTVNDAHGHAAGDAVLRHISDLILGQIRESDVFARIGGDEFGVILAHVTADQATKKGESSGEGAQRSSADDRRARPFPCRSLTASMNCAPARTPDTCNATSRPRDVRAEALANLRSLLRGDIGKQAVLDPRDLILELELALLEPCQLQLIAIGRTRVMAEIAASRSPCSCRSCASLARNACSSSSVIASGPMARTAAPRIAFVGWPSRFAKRLENVARNDRVARGKHRHELEGGDKGRDE